MLSPWSLTVIIFRLTTLYVLYILLSVFKGTPLNCRVLGTCFFAFWSYPKEKCHLINTNMPCHSVHIQKEKCYVLHFFHCGNYLLIPFLMSLWLCVWFLCPILWLHKMFSVVYFYIFDATMKQWCSTWRKLLKASGQKTKRGVTNYKNRTCHKLLEKQRFFRISS